MPLTWLLLNSQSTVDLIANQTMLVNIRKVRGKDAIRVHSNSRAKIVDMVDDLPGYKTVWYKPTVIENILSMSRGTKNCFHYGLPRQGRKVSAKPHWAILF